MHALKDVAMKNVLSCIHITRCWWEKTDHEKWKV